MVLPLGRLVDPAVVLADPEVRAADVRAGAGFVEIFLSDGSRHRSRTRGLGPEGPWRPGDPVDLLVENVGQLMTGVAQEDNPLGMVPGGAVAIAAGQVVAAGPETNVREVASRDDGTRAVDAEGRLVTPGLVDPHTHPVFAGDRSGEFALRARGATYQEIAAAGGGIRASVEATRAASEQTLFRDAAKRLGRLLRHGVTTLEAKSGYALDREGELRLLRVLGRLGRVLPAQVSPTLLGAHVVPPEHAEDRQTYVALVSDEMIPEAAREGLAESVDVFCEEGAFTREESERILRAAVANGLAARIHAEQFTDQGGAAMAASLGAVSADHLEAISPGDLETLAKAGTVAVLLPGAALTLRCPWPPVEAIRRAGVEMALGTDLNPGTSMTAHLPLMMSLGCTQMGMTVEEAWRGVTTVAAKAALRPDAGRLTPGAPGDLVLWDAAHPGEVPYRLGENLVHQVYVAGRLAANRIGARPGDTP